MSPSTELLEVDVVPAPLPPGHPGETDRGYRLRRAEITRAVENARTSRGLAQIAPTPGERALFATILSRLLPLHEQFASASYLEGFDRLGFSDFTLPSAEDLNARLQRETGFSVAMTDGLLDPRVFLTHLASFEQPCTAYLRHSSRPDYTPEPDLIHEAIGHMPLLIHPGVARVARTIGEAARNADEELLQALLRIYWFTLEFGLVRERTGLRAYGAGLLSSAGELPHAFSDRVHRRPFDLDAIVRQDYAHDRMQDVLFVADRFEQIEEAVDRFVRCDLSSRKHRRYGHLR